MTTQESPPTQPPVAKQVPHTWQRPAGTFDDPRMNVGTGVGAEFQSLREMEHNGQTFGIFEVPRDGEYTARVSVPGAQAAGGVSILVEPAPPPRP